MNMNMNMKHNYEHETHEHEHEREGRKCGDAEPTKRGVPGLGEVRNARRVNSYVLCPPGPCSSPEASSYVLTSQVSSASSLVRASRLPGSRPPRNLWASSPPLLRGTPRRLQRSRTLSSPEGAAKGAAKGTATAARARTDRIGNKGSGTLSSSCTCPSCSSGSSKLIGSGREGR